MSQDLTMIHQEVIRAHWKSTHDLVAAAIQFLDHSDPATTELMRKLWEDKAIFTLKTNVSANGPAGCVLVATDSGGESYDLVRFHRAPDQIAN